MNESLGERLRLAREEKGLDLRTIAEKTRIPFHILQSIEADDMSALPGGGYGRGVIRYFAKEVGVDPAEALKLFERKHGKSPASNDFFSGVEDADVNDGGRSKAKLTVGFLLALAVIVGGTLYYLKTTSSETADEVADLTEIAEPSPVLETSTPTPTPTPDSLSLDIGSTQSVTISLSVDNGQEEATTISPDTTRKVAGEESIVIGILGKNLASLNLKLGDRALSLPLSSLKELDRNYVLVTIKKEDLPRIISEGNIDKLRIELKRLRNSVSPSTGTQQTVPTNNDGTRKAEEQIRTTPPTGGDR